MTDRKVRPETNDEANPDRPSEPTQKRRLDDMDCESGNRQGTGDLLYCMSLAWRSKWDGIKDEVGVHVVVSVLQLITLILIMPALGITSQTVLEAFANTTQPAVDESQPVVLPTRLLLQIEHLATATDKSTREVQADETVTVVAPVETVVVTATPAPTGTPVPTHTPDHVCADSDIQPGQTYIVQPGDTLSCIALRSDRSLEQLRAANNISDVNRIDVGQGIFIPEDVH